MSSDDPKKPGAAATFVGRPQAPAEVGPTQVGLDAVGTDPGSPGPSSTVNTEPSLAPVVTVVGEAPKRAHPASETTADSPSGGKRRASQLAVPAQLVTTDTDVGPAPRRHSKIAHPAQGGTVPEAPPPRRASRLAVPAEHGAAKEGPTNVRDRPEEPVRRRSSTAVPASALAHAEAFTDQPTDPHGASPAPPAAPTTEPRWTLQAVAAATGAVSLAVMLGWVFWPGDRPARTAAAPQPMAAEPIAVATPKPAAIAPAAPAQPTEPDRPHLSLDAKTHVIDPFGMHAPDLELDVAHKYRLKLARDDAKLGTVLARLDDAKGWGSLRKMASHAALQFGGARALRLHCEPGRSFTEADTFPLELLDLASNRPLEFQVFPAKHCWDFEVTRTLELGEGVRHRVRVPTDSTVTLGEGVSLKVAWVLESLDSPRTFRTGVLSPGETLLAEGLRARFAILDPYSGDNDGRLYLELLDPDTKATGLATPTSGAQFVPVAPSPGTP